MSHSDSPILVLLRHGNTFESNETPVQVGARTDLALTDAGRAQAHAAAEYCRGHGLNIKTVASGPLRRQAETASIIARELALATPVEQVAALNEIDYGPWEGQTTDAIEHGWRDAYDDWRHAGIWPEAIFGSSFPERLEQIRTLVKALQARTAPGEATLCVSSNGILRLFQALDEPKWQALSNERQIESLKVGTGCLCLLDLSAAPPQVLSWNVRP